MSGDGCGDGGGGSDDDDGAPQRRRRPRKRGASRKAGAGGKGDASAGGGGESQGGGGGGGGGGGAAAVEEFLRGRLSVWQEASPLTELGLDSLDLVQLRNGFQKAFKKNVPLATFTNAQQTLAELIGKLAAKM